MLCDATFLSQIKTPWGKMIALRIMNVFLGHKHFLNSKRRSILLDQESIVVNEDHGNIHLHLYT